MESLVKSLQLELRTKDHELLTKDHELRTKDHELLTKDHELLTKDHELRIKDHEILEKDAYIQELENLIKLLQLRKYASRSEKNLTPDGDIFNSDESEEEICSAPAEAVTVEAHQRKTPKRKKLPKFLPRIDIIHDLLAEQKTCVCGCELSQISEVICEKLDIIPQVMQVLRHIRLKYACKGCNQTIKTAKLPGQPIPKSMASPGLLAHVVVSKYCDHLPLYRQAQIFKRNDIALNRGTLSQWMISCGILVQPIINLMMERLLEYDIAYSDETEIQVLKESGRNAKSKSYMWAFGGGKPEEFSWIFNYEPSRGSQIPLAFWDGFKGYIHVDAYAGYHKLEDKKQISLVNCMAHARRKFAEVAKLSKKKHGVSHEVIARMAKLYKIEKVLKEKKASIDDIKTTRQKQSGAILVALKAYLEEKQPGVLPHSPLGKAIAYTLNHWVGLTRYLDDGRLEIDNNRTERVIKPFATGRKNWMFCDSVKGADASANIYSLIETCKFHGVNPYDYLKYLFSEIKKCATPEGLEKMLPYQFKKCA
jgi:transposase